MVATVHVYQCVMCGLQWTSAEKLRGSHVQRSEYRRYGVRNNECVVSLFRLQIINNVACWDERCSLTWMEYRGQVPVRHLLDGVQWGAQSSTLLPQASPAPPSSSSVPPVPPVPTGLRRSLVPPFVSASSAQADQPGSEHSSTEEGRSETPSRPIEVISGDPIPLIDLPIVVEEAEGLLIENRRLIDTISALPPSRSRPRPQQID